MKIGIGVTTYKRPECLAKWKEQIDKTITNDHVIIHVAEDTDEDRKGIAYRKNECLRALKDCDYIFLFDDDCYPIQAGWMDFFINSGHEHLLFCSPKHHKIRGVFNDVTIYEESAGVFLFICKSAIDRVGGFNEEFGIYGFEHANYSNRILGTKFYPVLNNTDVYLYAEDYSNPQHKSSINTAEKTQHAFKNISLYNSTQNKTHISL